MEIRQLVNIIHNLNEGKEICGLSLEEISEIKRVSGKNTEQFIIEGDCVSFAAWWLEESMGAKTTPTSTILGY